MAIINLGILAHVDAGKTSLTERILFQTGVIDAVGSVDKGTTQTDTLELERARGITIKSAVVSFHLGDLKVNLIDTPGHADFVAEVERSLRVLDAVVLVVSAVEGVQPQTRRLARAVHAAGLPMLIFVNKIDRIGARAAPLLDDLRRKLNQRVVAMTCAAGLGERGAHVAPVERNDPAWRAPVTDLLAETDVRVIEEFDRTGGELGAAFLAHELRKQVAAGTVVPAFFGSAMTGAGVAELLDGVVEWLPPAAEQRDAEVDAVVFKIARLVSGEKLAYARLFAGELALRQHATIRRRDALGDIQPFGVRITGIDRFAAGSVVAADKAGAGEIVGLRGVRSARIGDRIGTERSDGRAVSAAFPLPALESVVRPVHGADITRLRAALEELAEQDPLISLRQRNADGEISIRLYGEVQKEVVAETLARDFGGAATFGPSKTICVERPVGMGEHLEVMFENGTPFYATVGFRIAANDVGSGVRYVRELGALPLAFYRAIEETARDALGQGLCGWEVTDCVVTLTRVGLCPLSTAADYRKVTPLALFGALRAAGTAVYEPVEELDLEVPEDAVGAVCGALAAGRATIRAVAPAGTAQRIVAEIPTAELRGVEEQLPRLTRGEGGWDSRFAGYVPVGGDAPMRARVGPNPLNREHYLAEVARS